ncbi:MAG: M18 family aminopeptidase [Oscillospiraceae bacterium]|nr:M18 family aminopeptidase [Oscillospiraceae bacterium]
MLPSLLRDIQESPTPFHAIEKLRALLCSRGYSPLPDTSQPLAAGGKYYMTPYGRSLIAFRLPKEKPGGLMITASHADSPCFRLRDRSELTGGDYTRLNVERYGGMLSDSWLDRPLSIAGRIVIRDSGGIRTQLVDFKRDMVLIPRLAIHFNREWGEGRKYDPATDLIPLYGTAAAAGQFYRELAQQAGCETNDILATDLFLYNNQPGAIWGGDGAFISAPRLDDLSCVFTCARAFLEAEENRAVPVLCVYDNEEIGSETKQGAASTALPGVVARIADFAGVDTNELLRHSLLLSCDNGHGKHPNHPELADCTEAPILGNGVVIKHSPRYATDAVSASLFAEICRRRGVPVQHYSNRPDQPGGGTLGNIAAVGTPVNTVDIGMAQLAMHSCFETVASADVSHFVNAVTACYEASLHAHGETVEIR